jgi:hypothetical protein
MVGELVDVAGLEELNEGPEAKSTTGPHAPNKAKKGKCKDEAEHLG